VLVVGGGIGGLALAGALGRRGVEVDVVDNQTEWAITRSGIALRAPALSALRALGLLDAVVTAGFGMTGFKYHDAAARYARRPSAAARRARASGHGRRHARRASCGAARRGRARAARDDGPGARARRNGRAGRR
jgi:2-polyprenyl-6-methoxyphenol hydroxylase-like FAD-dependent oxidoreductase